MAKTVIKKKKRIKLLSFLILITILTVIGFLVNAILSMPIKNIYINGNSIVSDDEIISLAKISNYPGFWKVSINKMRKGVLSNKYIKTVTIKRDFFNVLNIYVDEVEPLFIKASNNMLVLRDGSEIQNDNVLAAPKVINYIPDNIYNDFVERVSSFKDDVLNKISEIQYDPTDLDGSRFIFYMIDGNYVYLTLVKFNSLNYYNEVVSTLEGKKGILYLDSGNHFVAF